MSPKMALQQRYASSRASLLIVVVFTLINCILAATGSDTYFLFSASIPYYLAFYGSLFCGLMPEVYYTPESGFDPSFEFFDISALYIMLSIAVIITLVYGVFWFMSRKEKYEWLIAALIFFGVDTIGMIALSGFSVDMLLDVLMHAYVIISLISGITAIPKLKAVRAEEEAILQAEVAEEKADSNINNSDYGE